MNVLILDDQQAILDGMKKGVHWNRYNIKNLYMATNVSDAKKILQNHEVQIAFCDIEMPGENGIELVAWNQQNFPEIKNIFLTSHAEFGYAKKAVELGAFDYILQPAGYDEIEKVLKKAIEKWSLDIRQKKIYEYGKYMETKKELVAENIVYELLHIKDIDFDRMFQNLTALKYSCNKEMLYYPVLFQILDETFFDGWEDAQCQWTVENILQDLSEQVGKETLMYSSNKSTYFIILADCSEKEGMDAAIYIQARMEEILHCRVTGYSYEQIPIYKIRDAFEKLNKNKENNVTLRNGILTQETCRLVQEEVIELTPGVLEYWRTTLERGINGIVRKDIDRYLQQIVTQNQMNFQSMYDFFQKFTQIFLHIISVKNLDISQIFSREYTYADYNNSYKNIEKLKYAVNFAFDILDKYAFVEKKEKTYTELTQSYVVEHMESAIRIQDIADFVGLNADYLAKYFKKDTGMALKDYIVQTKIEMAKQLLNKTEKSVSEIAMDVGYDNVSNFIQVFKKNTQETPVEFRKKYQ